MQIKASKIDINGLFLESVIIDDSQPIPPDVITTPIPPSFYLFTGFYRPKWDGAKWVEGPSYTLEVTPSVTVTNEYTVTATLVNLPSPVPTSFTFVIAEKTFPANVTNNQAIIIVDLDEVIAGQAIAIKASATGCIDGTVTIGGTDKTTPNMLAKTQANGNIIVKCISKSEIKTYGDSISIAYPDRGADVANMIDLAFDALYKLLVWAQNPTYSAINLSPEEANAVSVMGSQYVPLMRLKLADMAPQTGSATTQNFRWPAVMIDKSNANPPANKILGKLADKDTTQP